MTPADILGYVATIIVLISFTQSDIKRLRILNILGCVLFGFYGFVLGAIPVIIINLSVILINIFFLIRK